MTQKFGGERELRKSALKRDQVWGRGILRGPRWQRSGRAQVSQTQTKSVQGDSLAQGLNSGVSPYAARMTGVWRRSPGCGSCPSLASWQASRMPAGPHTTPGSEGFMLWLIFTHNRLFFERRQCDEKGIYSGSSLCFGVSLRMRHH